MEKATSRTSTDNARILMYSQRGIYRPEVWRCTFYEFEQLVQQFELVDLVAPVRERQHDLRRINAQRSGKRTPIALNPGVQKAKVDREYDLFIAVCEKPSELLNVNMLKGWREKCTKSICWMAEIYIHEIPGLKAPLRVLSDFDYVLLNVARTVEPLSDALGQRCIYLPAGIDAKSFCPFPSAPARSIDVLSIGRRSENTHQRLLNMAKAGEVFYIYDTLLDLHTGDLAQHRFMLANLAKRSRYFIVNQGKINTPSETGGQVEFGYRYFEGAASGTVMVGDYPDSAEFQEYFGWDDAVIHLPFGSDRIGDIIHELDADPDRQQAIRKKNVANTLLKHDWAHRWQSILTMVELEPNALLLKRKNELEELSKVLSENKL